MLHKKLRRVWVPKDLYPYFISSLKTFKEIELVNIEEFDICYHMSFKFMSVPESALYNECWWFIFNHREVWISPPSVYCYPRKYSRYVIYCDENSFNISKDTDGLIKAIDKHGKEYKYYTPSAILKMYPDVIDSDHFNNEFYYGQGITDILENYKEYKESLNYENY